MTDLALLLAAARDAAPIALRHWRGDPAVEEKPHGQGPVSEADIAVDAFLRERLTGARPDAAWLSEETPEDGLRHERRDCFVVDPIDGTRAYLAGERSWALSLALVRDGRPMAAVVHMPARGLTYAAAAGAGATLTRGPAPDRDVPASAEPLNAAVRHDPPHVLANKASLKPAHWPRGRPDLAPHFRPSLAYRIALVAEGRFDAMLTLRPTWFWDVAAGVLIAREAGALATDPSGAEPVFWGEVPQLPGLVVAPPEIHGTLLP